MNQSIYQPPKRVTFSQNDLKASINQEQRRDQTSKTMKIEQRLPNLIRGLGQTFRGSYLESRPRDQSMLGPRNPFNPQRSLDPYSSTMGPNRSQAVQQVSQTAMVNSQDYIVYRVNKLFGNQAQKQLDYESLKPIFSELGLKYRERDEKDIIQLADIVLLKIQYPRQDLAEVHRLANRLGNFDLKNALSNIQGRKKCECCNLLVQTDQIDFKTPLKEVKNVGLSTHLYFRTITHLIFLMVFLLIVFSIFAIVTNLWASRMYQAGGGNYFNRKARSYEGFIAASLASKVNHLSDFAITTGYIQSWIVLITAFLWIPILFLIKMNQISFEEEIDKESISITDYTLVFQKMPKNVRKQELERQLQLYRQQIKKQLPGLFENSIDEPIKIRKINQVSPFYLDESLYDEPNLKKLNEKLDSFKETFINWVLQRQKRDGFPVEKKERDNFYHKYVKFRKMRRNQFREYANVYLNMQYWKNKSKDLLDVFVTFESTTNKELIKKLHDRQSSYIHNLPFFDQRKYFTFKRALDEGQTENISPIITPAPQPEDVKWVSLSHTTEQIRKIQFISFLITFVIITLTFIIIFALSGIQVQLKLEREKDLLTFIGATGISAIIPLINYLISIILTYLTKLQRHQSYTYEQNSIAFKAIMAKILNIICLPLMIAFLKGNIYGVDGLVDDVFYLALSNSFVSPALALVGLGYWFSVVRYKLWYCRIIKKMNMSQKQLNILNEMPEFEVGSSYSNIITLYLFTCFFITMQPLIVFFAIIGLTLSFYSSRYILYKRCKRPVPGDNLISARKFSFICLGPFVFAVGNFLWLVWSAGNEDAFTPSLLAIIVSVIAFLIPYTEISRKIKRSKIQYRKGTYQQDAAEFSCDYDEKNPLTHGLQPQLKKSTANEIKAKKEKWNQIKEEQAVGGVTSTNTNDKLKLAEFFKDIDGDFFIDPTQRKSEQELNIYPQTAPEPQKFRPVSIEVKQTPNYRPQILIEPIQIMQNYQPDPARGPAIYRIQNGQVITNTIAENTERRYIIGDGQHPYINHMRN